MFMSKIKTNQCVITFIRWKKAFVFVHSFPKMLDSIKLTSVSMVSFFQARLEKLFDSFIQYVFVRM